MGGERCTLHAFVDCPLCWRLLQERALFRGRELFQGLRLQQVMAEWRTDTRAGRF